MVCLDSGIKASQLNSAELSATRQASVFNLQTPLEAEYLAAACLCSSQAHCFVARNIRSGMVEGQAEAIFKAYVGFVGGARHVAYDCICW